MSNSNECLISRRDVNFLLLDWLQIESIIEHAPFTDHSRFTISATLDLFESIAKAHFTPHNRKNDEYEPQFDGERVTLNSEIKKALEAFSEAGLMAATQNEDIGGMKLPTSVDLAGMAYMFAANAGSIGYAFLTKANANLLLAHGAADLVDRFVKPMMEGAAFGTMCLSEPQAGSSLADIRTRALLMPDGRYRIFGSKMWISGGEHELTDNIVHAVLAKIPNSDGKLPPGTEGISLFVAPKRLVDLHGNLGERNDVALAGLNHKMGYRGTVNCALNFGEGRFTPEGEAGAIGEIIGEPGKGLAYMFHMMNEARIGVGLGAAAMGYSGYLHALDYARERLQGRLRSARDPSTPQTPIIAHSDVKRMLLAAKCYAEGSLALVLYCAKLFDETRIADKAAKHAHALLDLLTPVAKSWPSQWGLAANDIAIQVLGGAGYTRDYPVEQLYRDNRLNPIHEGTHGIQALDLLGRKVARGDGLALLSERITTTITAAREDEILAPHANMLDHTWKRISCVTEALHALSDVDERLANATAYLEAFGHIVVGWLWLDQARSALALRASPEADMDFISGKLQACRFYFAWELPKIEAWLGVLDPVDTCTLAMKDNWY